MKQKIKQIFTDKQKPSLMASDIWKYIGPGMLVTVGFIDPGNWASNVAAGSNYGYTLLWMVTISTIMLIILQHNSAHLGIATGLCLSEAATKFMKPWLSRTVLSTAILAAISTALAELLGGAIALQMLFKIPINIGVLFVLIFVAWMLFSNSYRKIEKWIIGFVSLIGLSFVFELSMVDIEWGQAAVSWVTPSFPHGSIVIIMSVLGAVVMPHNLFLHSEVIQSRQWNLKDEKVIKHQLKYEFYDTLFSMIIGWAINSSMILLAAAAFFTVGIKVDELGQAQKMLEPLVGNASSIIFAIALLFAGVASSVTAGLAGGSIFAGVFGEPYDIKDNHTRLGVGIVLISAVVLIYFISDPFTGLIISQMLLSIQLPFTIFLQIYLTSSKKVMGSFANDMKDSIMLWIIGLFVSGLNIYLFINTVL
ncbi:MAG: Nramp family divalent metal transporter [Bacteroidetes bacterium]|nr:Nramp family divalent metal transporter [Bacteroidota bacterium]